MSFNLYSVVLTFVYVFKFLQTFTVYFKDFALIFESKYENLFRKSFILCWTSFSFINFLQNVLHIIIVLNWLSKLPKHTQKKVKKYLITLKYYGNYLIKKIASVLQGSKRNLIFTNFVFIWDDLCLRSLVQHLFELNPLTTI